MKSAKPPRSAAKPTDQAARTVPPGPAQKPPMQPTSTSGMQNAPMTTPSTGSQAPMQPPMGESRGDKTGAPATPPTTSK